MYKRLYNSYRVIDLYRGYNLVIRWYRYLYGHSLKLDLPEELVKGARGLISDEMLENLPKSLTLPLAETDSNQGMTFHLN